MIALKILKERLIDLERISKMYQSTQVQVDILETKVAIAELEALQQRSCESCRHWDFNEQGHFKKCFNGKGNVSSTKGDFCCNRYEQKEQCDDFIQSTI